MIPLWLTIRLGAIAVYLFSSPRSLLHPRRSHIITRSVSPPPTQRMLTERPSTFVFPGYVLLDPDRHIAIIRLVQGVPSNRGSADPNYADSPPLEEDVREGCRTELRRETIVDNGRATGYLLRGTSCAPCQTPTYLPLPRFRFVGPR